eukprot:XP_015582215.1 WAT1-related protein At3g28050 isoform X1 [Ricinus communis]
MPLLSLSLFLLPSSFTGTACFRRRPRPQLTVSIIFRTFLLGLLSCCVQMFMNTGVKYSSPTLSAAMIDLTPAFTFLLAIISRMEKLDYKSQSTQAKSIGTIVSVAGALIVTLYKGQPITTLPSESNSLNQPLLLLSSTWVTGGIFCTAGALCLALLYIVQTWILKDCPAELIITCIACFFVTVLSSIVALVAEKDISSWILKPDIELIATFCSAVFAVSIRSVVHAWACRKKGPLYASMFKPLGIIIATFLGFYFLGDTLYDGSVIGGIIIALGFYSVLWGKAQEEKMGKDERNSSFESSASPKAPLLRGDV